MLFDKESSFNFYSFGIVVENKARGSAIIRVVPIEEISLATGQIEDLNVKTPAKSTPNVKFIKGKEIVPLGDQKMTYSVTVPDHKKINRSDGLTGEVSIQAKWTALGQSNRITPPDVVKSETVMIYKVSDTGEFYWTTILSENLRRLETVVYSYSNMPKGIVAFDSETSYWFKVSTHDKQIHLHTAKNDGEQTAWDIDLDTAKGILKIDDNSGNTLEFNSADASLTANFLNNITLKAPKIKLDGDVSVTGTLDVAKDTSLAQNLSVGGSTNISGGMSGGGSISAGGNITSGGSISASGTVSGTNI